jgi:hypothetical protein
LVAYQDEDAIQAEEGSGSSRLPAVVRLDRAGGDQCAGAVGLCLGYQQFELAGLISTQGKACLVVSFDQ